MRALLSFFTAFPARSASLDEAARSVYLLPLVGLLTGAPGAALIAWGLCAARGVAATLALGAVLLAAGLHHTDGVLDVGDALMVRGDPERRRAVLKDTRVGVGGIGALFLVYAPALAALISLTDHSPARAALALLAAEVSVRSAMLLVLAFGKPAEAGSSSVPFVRSLTGWGRTGRRGAGLARPPLLLLPLGTPALLAAVPAPLTALAGLRLSRRAFGGIGGDVVGATGEAARSALLVVLSATI